MHTSFLGTSFDTTAKGCFDPHLRLGAPGETTAKWNARGRGAAKGVHRVLHCGPRQNRGGGCAAAQQLHDHCAVGGFWLQCGFRFRFQTATLAAQASEVRPRLDPSLRHADGRQM